MDDFFAPPAFDAAQALSGLQRSLRALGLSERAGHFEWQGWRVAALEPGAQQISAKMAQSPALQPRWERRELKNSADVRQYLDELKKRLARWSDD